MFDFTRAYKKYAELTSDFFKDKDIEEIKNKSQYFTPLEEAEKLVGDLHINGSEAVRILDPACGNGILLLKILEKLLSNYTPNHLIIDVYDIDSKLLENVREILTTIDFGEIKLSIKYINEDFIYSNQIKEYDYIIMNPPYKKINVAKVPEEYQKFLFGQPNLYHLFIAKALNFLAIDGILCCMSPKSYLGGKYTEKLRHYIINRFSIIKIHTFNDRTTIFGNNITQEICILHIKNSHEKNVIVSYNGNQKFTTELSEIIHKNNTKIVHTPRSMEDCKLVERFKKFPIKTIGSEILMKTGKVVQFRVVGKETNLKDEEFFYYEKGVPLIVYRHINTNEFKYQRLLKKTKNKAITLLNDGKNKSLLIKNSNYVLIRKNIDKKYDKLIHSVGYLKDLQTEKIAFDNGIAYLTNSNDSLTKEEVLGLQCILMSKQFDDYYRMINSSHTINIYELENMHFPDIETIRLIGRNMITNSLGIDKATEIFESYLSDLSDLSGGLVPVT